MTTVAQQPPSDGRPEATDVSVVPEQIYSDEILDNHKIWRKNAPELYDYLLTMSMPWPSLTIQFMPDVEKDNERGTATQRLLAGTQTNGNGHEVLRLMRYVRSNVRPQTEYFDEHKGEFFRYTNSSNKVDIFHRINHQVGEINRARYMPQNCDLIATMASSGRAYVFDRSKHPSEAAQTFKAEMVLDHHKVEGFGLAWNTLQRGQLLTASDTIALWDVVSQYKSDDKGLVPQRVWNTHTKLVNEVDWQPQNQHIFISASDDARLIVHDLRSDSDKVEMAYNVELNCVKFNLGFEHLVASGSNDGALQLWDLRKTSSPYSVSKGHTDAITSLQWSPFEPAVLATASPDKTVAIWDISQQQEPLFRHGGHKADVTDICWNPDVPWEIASVGLDNQLHIWRLAQTIVQPA